MTRHNIIECDECGAEMDELRDMYFEIRPINTPGLDTRHFCYSCVDDSKPLLEILKSKLWW